MNRYIPAVIACINMTEDKAIDELAPKLGLMPPGEWRQLCEDNAVGMIHRIPSDRGIGRTTTAILRALVRLQSGVDRILFIGYGYDQAADNCRYISLVLDMFPFKGHWQYGKLVPLSARDRNLDTRLRGVLSRSIVIDSGAIQYISPEAMAVIEGLHP